MIAVNERVKVSISTTHVVKNMRECVITGMSCAFLPAASGDFSVTSSLKSFFRALFEIKCDLYRRSEMKLFSSRFWNHNNMSDSDDKRH